MKLKVMEIIAVVFRMQSQKNIPSMLIMQRVFPSLVGSYLEMMLLQ